MKIDVYLNKEIIRISLIDRENYYPSRENIIYCGTIDAFDLESAFRRLQHGFHTRDVPLPRKIAIGDILKTKAGYFLIDLFDFKLLDWNDE